MYSSDCNLLDIETKTSSFLNSNFVRGCLDAFVYDLDDKSHDIGQFLRVFRNLQSVVLMRWRFSIH